MRGAIREISMKQWKKNGMFCQQVFCRKTALFFSQWDTFLMTLRHTHIFTAIPTIIVLRVSALWSVSKDNGGGCEWLTKSSTLWEALHEHEIWVWPVLVWVHLNLRHETQYVPFKFLNVYIMKKNMFHNVTAKIWARVNFQSCWIYRLFSAHFRVLMA